MKTKKPNVDTAQYEFSHGHKPRGRGSWAFATSPNPADGDKIGFIYGAYAEAKKVATRYFAGAPTIWVLP